MLLYGNLSGFIRELLSETSSGILSGIASVISCGPHFRISLETPPGSSSRTAPWISSGISQKGRENKMRELFLNYSREWVIQPGVIFFSKTSLVICLQNFHGLLCNFSKIYFFIFSRVCFRNS